MPISVSCLFVEDLLKNVFGEYLNVSHKYLSVLVREYVNLIFEKLFPIYVKNHKSKITIKDHQTMDHQKP